MALNLSKRRFLWQNYQRQMATEESADIPAGLRERPTCILSVPVPSSWYGKSGSDIMTFDEALKALNSDKQKKAVGLMKEIDKQLGIEAELSSGVNESADGAHVVIVHNIKTRLNSEKLRYVAAVKAKALMEKSPDSKIF
jgi:hypothetical protein